MTPAQEAPTDYVIIADESFTNREISLLIAIARSHAKTNQVVWLVVPHSSSPSERKLHVRIQEVPQGECVVDHADRFIREQFLNRQTPHEVRIITLDRNDAVIDRLAFVLAEFEKYLEYTLVLTGFTVPTFARTHPRVKLLTDRLAVLWWILSTSWFFFGTQPRIGLFRRRS